MNVGRHITMIPAAKAMKQQYFQDGANISRDSGRRNQEIIIIFIIIIIIIIGQAGDVRVIV